MDHTRAVDCYSEHTHALIRNDQRETNPEPFTNRDPSLIPPCTFLSTSLSRNGYYVVVDTEDGYVYRGDPNGELNATRGRFNHDPANKWRDSFSGLNVYRLADFFALCNQRFRELRWVGIDQWNFSALRMNSEWYNLSEEDEQVELVVC